MRASPERGCDQEGMLLPPREAPPRTSGTHRLPACFPHTTLHLKDPATRAPPGRLFARRETARPPVDHPTPSNDPIQRRPTCWTSESTTGADNDFLAKTMRGSTFLHSHITRLRSDRDSTCAQATNAPARVSRGSKWGAGESATGSKRRDWRVSKRVYPQMTAASCASAQIEEFDPAASMSHDTRRYRESQARSPPDQRTNSQPRAGARRGHTQDERTPVGTYRLRDLRKDVLVLLFSD